MEIVLEVNKEYIEQSCQLITDSMERAGKIFCKKIPMIAEAHVSEFWEH